jgi:hypothetical protein
VLTITVYFYDSELQKTRHIARMGGGGGDQKCIQHFDVEITWKVAA